MGSACCAVRLTASGSQVLAEAKEAKEAAFQAQWKQMKTGAPSFDDSLCSSSRDRGLSLTADTAAVLTFPMNTYTRAWMPVSSSADSSRQAMSESAASQNKCTQQRQGRRQNRPKDDEDQIHHSWLYVNSCIKIMPMNPRHALHLSAGKNRPLDEDELDFVNAVERSKAAAERAWLNEQAREMDAFREARSRIEWLF